MFAICVESSHGKGMGHLYRALNFIDLLQSKKEEYILFINSDQAAIELLESRNIRFETVDLTDDVNNWETALE